MSRAQEEAGSRRACPYCRRPQAAVDAWLWRCPGCNLHLRSRDLVDPGASVELDAVSQDYCPWCGYPVAEEFSVPDEEGFRCPGCAGSLSADMLVPRAALERYRKKRLAGVHHLLFMLVLVAIIVATCALMTS